MTPEQIQAITDYAKLQFSVEEVAVIMEISPQAIADDAEATKAFMRGRLQAQAVVRQAIYDGAKNGGTQTIKQFIDLAESSEPMFETQT